MMPKRRISSAAFVPMAPSHNISIESSAATFAWTLSRLPSSQPNCRTSMIGRLRASVMRNAMTGCSRRRVCRSGFPA